MSYAAVDLVMQSEIRDKAEFAVLLALAWRADEHGRCHPGKARLAHEARLTTRAIPAVLARLEAGGYLRIRRGHGRSNTHDYELALDFLKGEARAPFGEREKVNPLPEKVNRVPEKVNGVPIKGEPGSPEQVKEQIKNRSENKPTRARKPKKKPQPEPLPSWLDPDTWGEFVQHRIEKKSRLTPTARRNALAKLARIHDEGRDPNAALRHTLEQGWTGIYEPKPERRNGSRRDEAYAARQDPAGAFDRISREVDAALGLGPGGVEYSADEGRGG